MLHRFCWIPIKETLIGTLVDNPGISAAEMEHSLRHSADHTLCSSISIACFDIHQSDFTDLDFLLSIHPLLPVANDIWFAHLFISSVNNDISTGWCTDVPVRIRSMFMASTVFLMRQ
jgi:hypothetical protein